MKITPWSPICPKRQGQEAGESEYLRCQTMHIVKQIPQGRSQPWHSIREKTCSNSHINSTDHNNALIIVLEKYRYPQYWFTTVVYIEKQPLNPTMENYLTPKQKKQWKLPNLKLFYWILAHMWVLMLQGQWMQLSRSQIIS